MPHAADYLENVARRVMAFIFHAALAKPQNLRRRQVQNAKHIQVAMDCLEIAVLQMRVFTSLAATAAKVR